MKIFHFFIAISAGLLYAFLIKIFKYFEKQSITELEEWKGI